MFVQILPVQTKLLLDQVQAKELEVTDPIQLEITVTQRLHETTIEHAVPRTPIILPQPAAATIRVQLEVPETVAVPTVATLEAVAEAEAAGAKIFPDLLITYLMKCPRPISQ